MAAELQSVSEALGRGISGMNAPFNHCFGDNQDKSAAEKLRNTSLVYRTIFLKT
jgi:hypothetical protein